MKDDFNLDKSDLVISDEVERVIKSIDNNLEDSDSYEDFVSEASDYSKFRLDIKNNINHKDDYLKLIDFYRDDIEKGIYKIGLANELQDDDLVVDASRGVIIYENKRNRR